MYLGFFTFNHKFQNWTWWWKHIVLYNNKIKPNFLLSLYLGIATSSTMTAIPSTPPMGIPRNSHQSRSGSPTKSGSQPGGYPGPTGSPVPPMPPQSYQQVGADLTDNVANFAQSTFSTFSNFLQKPEKLASGKETINEVDLGVEFLVPFFSLSVVNFLSENIIILVKTLPCFTQMMMFSTNTTSFWTKKVSFDNFSMTTWERENKLRKKRNNKFRAL